MSRTIRVPIDPNGKFTLIFPDKCIYCGQPTATKSELTVERRTYLEGKRVKLSSTLQIPYCEKHAKEAVRNKAIIVIMMVPISIIALAVYLPGWEETGLLTGIRCLDLAIRGAIWLAVVIGATYLMKLILSLFARSFIHTPIPLRAIFFEEATSLGIIASIQSDGRAMNLRFSNDQFAHELEQINKWVWQQRSSKS